MSRRPYFLSGLSKILIDALVFLFSYFAALAIALEGVKVPETIIKLSKEKECTAFLDGDHGGDLILKELMQVATIKYVARAPSGKEVEDLTAKEIEVALQNKKPIEEAREHREFRERREPREYRGRRERREWREREGGKSPLPRA
jgi:DNA primase